MSSGIRAGRAAAWLALREAAQACGVQGRLGALLGPGLPG